MPSATELRFASKTSGKRAQAHQSQTESRANSKMFNLTRTAVRRSLPKARGFSAKPTSSFVAADQTIQQNRIYHKSHYLALGIVPVALLAHPSPLTVPLDVALAVILPLHAHIGMNWIFTDYVPGSPTGPARMALLATTVLATVGLLKLSLTDAGIVGTVKELWTGAEEKKKKASK